MYDVKSKKAEEFIGKDKIENTINLVFVFYQYKKVLHLMLYPYLLS